MPVNQQTNMGKNIIFLAEVIHLHYIAFLKVKPHISLLLENQVTFCFFTIMQFQVYSLDFQRNLLLPRLYSKKKRKKKNINRGSVRVP